MDPVQMRIKNSSFEHHAQILEVWEKSVRASHHFLNIQQIDQIKFSLPNMIISAMFNCFISN